MLLQWLINIHDCQSRNIKTCNPHIHNNRYLKIGIIIFKLAIRPEWGIPKKAENESVLTKEQKDKLLALPKINLVATRRKDDRKELYQACGTNFNADIIYYQTFIFPVKNSVDTGNRLN